MNSKIYCNRLTRWNISISKTFSVIKEEKAQLKYNNVSKCNCKNNFLFSTIPIPQGYASFSNSSIIYLSILNRCVS